MDSIFATANIPEHDRISVPNYLLSCRRSPLKNPHLGRGGDPARPGSRAQLSKAILADTNLTLVLDKARALLKTGLNAGSGYGEVWIRDLNTFIEVALEVNDAKPIREALLTFFKFQGSDGNIVDGYIPKARASVGYKYRKWTSRRNCWRTEHRQTIQESYTLVQAIRKYVSQTGDRKILPRKDRRRNRPRLLGSGFDLRLHGALRHQPRPRLGSATSGLGRRAAGTFLGRRTRREFPPRPGHLRQRDADHRHRGLPATARTGSSQAARWRTQRDSLKRNVREHLWDGQRQKFIPHICI